MSHIAKNMAAILQKANRTCVWYGDIELLEECAIVSGVAKKHPQRTIQCILNALDKSSLFEKGYITSDVSGSRRKYRCFRLIPPASENN